MILLGETYIAATQRSDGTWRKPRKYFKLKILQRFFLFFFRVKTGYIPQEEQPKFESRAQQMMRQANSTLKFPVGYCPTKMQKKQELKMPPPPTTATLIDLNSSKPVAAIYKPNASITPQDHINKKINTLKKKLNEIKNLKVNFFFN